MHFRKSFFVIFIIFALSAVVFISCCSVSGEEEVTQGDFVIKIVKLLRLEYKLPKGATAENYAVLLKEEGFNLPENFSPGNKITKAEKAAILSQLISHDSTAEVSDVSRLDIYRNRAMIEKIQGGVFIKTVGSEEWKPAEVNMPLTEGDYIKTEKNSTVSLKVGVAGKVLIQENSEMLLKELATQANKKSERVLMYLAFGEMTVDARFAEKNSVIEAYTPTAVAAVRGTVYTLKVMPGTQMTEIREEL
jgi:hypothetical protein